MRATSVTWTATTATTTTATAMNKWAGWRWGGRRRGGRAGLDLPRGLFHQGDRGGSGRNPEGLCPPSDLTRHKAERTVRRLIEEALRENLNQQNFLFVFFVEKKTIQFPFTKIFPSVITGIPPSHCPARTLPWSTPSPVVTFAARKRAPDSHFVNPRPPWPPWPASPSSPGRACQLCS